MTSVANLETAPQAVNTPGHATSIVSFLRTADTTAYTALDTISTASGTSQVLEFPNTGRSGAILRATITIAEDDTIAPRLWVFDAEPTNFADNAAFTLVAADMPKIVGRFDFVDADKLDVGVALNVYFSSGDTTAANEVALKMPYVTDSGSLFGILQTVPGYTPISAAKFTIKLGLERD